MKILFNLIKILFLYIFCIFFTHMSLAGAVSSKKTPIDVRIIIDLSNPANQKFRNQVIESFVNTLPSGSRAGIWTYGKYVNMLVPLGLVNEKWRSIARKSVNFIQKDIKLRNTLDAMDIATSDWIFYGKTGHNPMVYLYTEGKIVVSSIISENKEEESVFEKKLLPIFKKLNVKVIVATNEEGSHYFLLKKLAALHKDGFLKLIKSKEDIILSVSKAIFYQKSLPQKPAVVQEKWAKGKELKSVGIKKNGMPSEINQEALVISEKNQKFSKEVKAAEVKAAEVKAAEVKAAEVKAAEVKAAEVKAAEVKAAEVKAAEVKAAEVKALEIKPEEIKKEEQKLVETEAVSKPSINQTQELLSDLTKEIEKNNITKDHMNNAQEKQSLVGEENKIREASPLQFSEKIKEEVISEKQKTGQVTILGGKKENSEALRGDEKLKDEVKTTKKELISPEEKVVGQVMSPEVSEPSVLKGWFKKLDLKMLLTWLIIGSTFILINGVIFLLGRYFYKKWQRSNELKLFELKNGMTA